ncbi:hypothetical protein TRFO_03397 [Tritrichomonas foetus]|uniref:Uncharacterized protein n=1 Tax=Tritrichomonas foetus TaxID=1144522 RepID=A0A1J4KU38_9EUKA|nr:hypothetical protein TRFO_03397 [Tritrichomonas foetus]|eukprot:OHT13005.1 hypothetical protein TRFO_03397 [Tritrichomonas foetus]
MSKSWNSFFLQFFLRSTYFEPTHRKVNCVNIYRRDDIIKKFPKFLSFDSMCAKCITSGSHDGFRIGRPDLENNKPGPIPLPENCLIKLVALGWKHGHIIINDNQMYSWGSGKSYRLGTGNKTDSEIPIHVTTIPPKFEFRMIAAGDAFGAAISMSGQLIAWGSKFAHKPTLFSLPATATYLACGHSSILCALSNGTVQQIIGRDRTQNITLLNETAIMTAAGSNHFLVLTSSGNVYSWGCADASGFPYESSVPTLLNKTNCFTSQIAAIFAYQDNSWFIDKQNNVYRCGKNEEGCLGSGNTDYIKTPTLLNYNFDNKKVIQIACGDNFTIILTEEGVAYAAGSCKECRSAISSEYFDDHKIFHRCTNAIEPGITQVACGCYSAAFVIGGDLPPNIQYFYKSFRDYPIPAPDSSLFLEKGNVITVSSDTSSVERCGLKIEDIIKFEDGTLAKIVAVAANKNSNNKNGNKAENDEIAEGNNKVSDGTIIAITEKISYRAFSSLNYEAVLFHYELVERPGHNLSPIPLYQDKIVQLDISDEELFKFRGLKFGDVLQDGSTIVGARGPHLYSLSSDKKSVHEILTSDCTFIKRNTIKVELYQFVDGETRIVEICDENEKNKLRFDHIYGSGIFIGKVHKYYCYQFASDFGLSRLIDHECPIVREAISIPKNENQPNSSICTLNAFSTDLCSITLSILPMLSGSNSLYPYDFVFTPKGPGCLAGFYNDQVAVYLENSKGFVGCVTLFNENEVIPKARLFAPLKINDMSANSVDFIHSHFLPGDEVEIDNQTFLIVGIKDNKLYCQNKINHSDCMSCADENLVEVDEKRAKLVFRHLYADAYRKCGKKICGCSSQFAQDMASIKHGQILPKGKVVGLYSHTTLLLNDNGNCVLSGFDLPKI